MTTIRVCQAVRYIAKEPPKGHDRPRRGDIGHVSQMNADKTRAQLGGLGIKGAIWVDVDALEGRERERPVCGKARTIAGDEADEVRPAPKPERDQQG